MSLIVIEIVQLCWPATTQLFCVGDVIDYNVTSESPRQVVNARCHGVYVKCFMVWLNYLQLFS